MTFVLMPIFPTNSTNATIRHRLFITEHIRTPQKTPRHQLEALEVKLLDYRSWEGGFQLDHLGPCPVAFLVAYHVAKPAVSLEGDLEECLEEDLAAYSDASLAYAPCVEMHDTRVKSY